MRKYFVLCAVLLWACVGSTEPTAVGTAAHFDIVSGNAQQGTAGQQLAEPLVVRVTDSTGQAVAGIVINFRVVAGGGTVFAGSAASNKEGLVKELWTLGTVARDSQRVEGRAVDPRTGAAQVFGVFQAQAHPGPAQRLSKVVDPQLTTVGTITTLGVRVLDSYENAITNVMVRWQSDSGGLVGTTKTDTTGVATLDYQADQHVGTTNIHAVVDALPAQVFSVTTQAGPPAMLERLSGDTQSAVVNTIVDSSLVVRVTDAYGNPLSGVLVTFVPTTGGGVLPVSVQTDVRGQASTRWRLSTVAGTQQVQATTATLTTTFTARAIADVLRHFGITGPLQVGVGVPFDVTVSAQDLYGNTVQTYKGMPTLSATGTLNLSGIPLSSFVNGSSTARVTLTTAGSFIFRATDGSITGISLPIVSTP